MNRTKSKFKLAVFDIDCTLILTGGAGMKAFKTVINELFPGASNKIPNDYKPHGRTDLSIFNDYVRFAEGRNPSYEEISLIKTKYLKELPKELEKEKNNYKILPGVKELLEFLSSIGVLIGLGTGNLIEAAEIKLKPSGLLNYFSFGGYGSDSEDRTEILQKALERGCAKLGENILSDEVVFVGDTIRDIEAARGAGGKIIAVATGINSVKDLKSADIAVKNLFDKKIRDFFCN